MHELCPVAAKWNSCNFTATVQTNPSKHCISFQSMKELQCVDSLPRSMARRSLPSAWKRMLLNRLIQVSSFTKQFVATNCDILGFNRFHGQWKGSLLVRTEECR